VLKQNLVVFGRRAERRTEETRFKSVYRVRRLRRMNSKEREEKCQNKKDKSNYAGHARKTNRTHTLLAADHPLDPTLPNMPLPATVNAFDTRPEQTPPNPREKYMRETEVQGKK